MATAVAAQEPILAGDDERKALVSIERSLRAEGQARLIAPDGTSTPVPVSLFTVLLESVRQLSEGNAVAILPVMQELTTQQAADLLNVSRPHVVAVLESGKIPHHKVGTHRRVYLPDLITYKQSRDHKRRAALQALVDDAQDLGIYEG